ncbi:hypothetical protein [Halococcus sp. IIIV-5B]|uniref:hypothetical protein n=1 Tax=Halococcus sp. IIIV-5B TaxID=2321230 RepID=UPI000E73E6CA|nr:hypothetical protein [Halococcus sp. IIIV-5B]RJT03394.1 hypothetical protein D3261_10845 [Halococcus sp. IIIV-5B]
MNVHDWQDILSDVTESGADAGGWRAVAGNRASGIGEDMYLGHPSAGVYQLKTYAKNPFEVRGVGTRVARRIDDDLDSLFPKKDAGRFGVQSPMTDENEATEAARDLESVLEAHSDAPTTPGDLFEDVMGALDSPAYGPMEHDSYGRPDGLDDLSGEFEEAERLLNTELDELVDADETNRGFQ